MELLVAFLIGLAVLLYGEQAREAKREDMGQGASCALWLVVIVGVLVFAALAGAALGA